MTTHSLATTHSLLPTHLGRGVPFSNLMHFFGWLLRIRPDQLPKEDQTKLWDLSVPAERLAFFFSHCWGSPGYQKYVALLFYVMAPWALLVGLGAALAVHAIQALFYEFPCFDVFDKAIKAHYCLSVWEFVAGISAGWATLLLGPIFFSSKVGFLDCACIHQTDLNLKIDGIQHLASFLKASDELVIAWDPLYFTRGWCTFELAVFKGLQPRGRTAVLPVRLYYSMLMCHLAMVICIAIFFVCFYFLQDVSLVVLLTFLGLFSYGAYEGEKLAVEKAEMSRQLQNFTFRHASVAIESDRQEIQRTIENLWAGGVDEFDQMVRTEIRDDIEAEFNSRKAILPYPMMLIAAVPNFAFVLGFCTGYIRNTHLPRLVWVNSCIANLNFTFCIYPCLMALGMSMAAGGGGEIQKATVATAEDAPALAPPSFGVRHVGAGLLCTVAYTIAAIVDSSLPILVETGHFAAIPPYTMMIFEPCALLVMAAITHNVFKTSAPQAQQERTASRKSLLERRGSVP